MLVVLEGVGDGLGQGSLSGARLEPGQGGRKTA
jgi:hypothetical protein